MSFGEDMARLTAIIDEVESEDVTMERSLALFEEGVGLIKRCRDFLMEAKRKITLLSAEGEIPWEAEDDTAKDKG